jgi:hypothetical protein
MSWRNFLHDVTSACISYPYVQGKDAYAPHAKGDPIRSKTQIEGGRVSKKSRHFAVNMYQVGRTSVLLYRFAVTNIRSPTYFKEKLWVSIEIWKLVTHMRQAEV